MRISTNVEEKNFKTVAKKNKGNYILFGPNTMKASKSEHFQSMFEASIGLANPNRDFMLCKVV